MASTHVIEVYGADGAKDATIAGDWDRVQVHDIARIFTEAGFARVAPEHGVLAVQCGTNSALGNVPLPTRLTAETGAEFDSLTPQPGGYTVRITDRRTNKTYQARFIEHRQKDYDGAKTFFGSTERTPTNPAGAPQRQPKHTYRVTLTTTVYADDQQAASERVIDLLDEINNAIDGPEVEVAAVEQDDE